MKTCRLENVPELISYIEDVEKEKYPVCKQQKALCAFIRKVFSSGAVYVDTDQLKAYMSNAKHFFKLYPWEKFLFTLHNCTYNKEDDSLRFPVLFALVGRGAGKNGYLSFECFSLMTPVHGVKDYLIDLFAYSEDQAKTSFEDIRNILESDHDFFSKYWDWTKTQITNKKTQSALTYHTASAKSKNGARPGMVAFDELHTYESYDLIDTARTGLGKKKNSRQTIISSNGTVRGGPLDDYLDLADDILFHDFPDNGWLPFICKLENKDEMAEESLWTKANPSLPYNPDLVKEMRRDYADYKRNPAKHPLVPAMRFGLPLQEELQSVTSWENIKRCSVSFDDTGADCIAAIDYASTTDFVSVGLLSMRGGRYQWREKVFICKNSRDLPGIKAPVQGWAADGWAEIVDAPEIPPEMVVRWLEEQAESVNITGLCIDSYRYTLMAKALDDGGFPKEKIKLIKRADMAKAAPLIESAFNTGAIVWGEDPFMSWFTNNTTVLTTRYGNTSYGKKEMHYRKNDGFMAMASAFAGIETFGMYDAEEDYESDVFSISF